MRIFYNLYDGTSGRILRSIPRWDDQPLFPTTFNNGDSILAAAENSAADDPALKYINTTTEAVIDRPASPIVIDKTAITADDVDAAIITLIPVGAEAVITDGTGVTTMTVNDGALEISSPTADTISVSISFFPDLIYVVEVVAT